MSPDKKNPELNLVLFRALGSQPGPTHLTDTFLKEKIVCLIFSDDSAQRQTTSASILEAQSAQIFLSQVELHDCLV